MTYEELLEENARLKSKLEVVEKLAREHELESIAMTYLDGAGVDNWDGYDDAMENYSEYINSDEFVSDFDDL